MGLLVKEIGMNMIASIAGVITAVLISFLLIIVLFLFLLLFPVSDSLIANPIIQAFFIIAISTSCIGGGYITGLFVRKKYPIYTFICGLVLTILYLIKFDFKVNYEIFPIIQIIIILPSTIVGGYLINSKELKA